MPEVKIVQANPVQVLSSAHTGPYDQARKHMDEMYQWIMRKGYSIAGPGMGLFYDDPTKIDPVKCRYEICYPVFEACEGSKTVTRKVLTSHQMATMDHMGGLGNIMSQTYATLFTWIGQNGYVYDAGEPIREVYKVGHLEAAIESDCITEVQIPVRKV